jgi:branched-subunit amino acid transport protein
MESLPSLSLLLTYVGLTFITLITRSFFFIPKREWKLPAWAERGLQYAPLAAISAVIAPEILMKQGQFNATWQDARLFATVAACIFFFWRKHRGQPVLGTILVGMAVYLPLHLGLGW